MWEPLSAFVGDIVRPKTVQGGRKRVQALGGRKRAQPDAGRCSSLLGPHFTQLFGGDALEPMATTDAVEWLALHLNEILGLEVDAVSIRDAVAGVIPFSLECTRLNAFTLLVCYTTSTKQA